MKLNPKFAADVDPKTGRKGTLQNSGHDHVKPVPASAPVVPAPAPSKPKPPEYPPYPPKADFSDDE